MSPDRDSWFGPSIENRADGRSGLEHNNKTLAGVYIRWFYFVSTLSPIVHSVHFHYSQILTLGLPRLPCCLTPPLHSYWFLVSTNHTSCWSSSICTSCWFDVFNEICQCFVIHVRSNKLLISLISLLFRWKSS